MTRHQTLEPLTAQDEERARARDLLAQRTLHSEQANARMEEPLRALDTSDRPLQFERIPNVCLVADVCRILQMSERQLYRLLARKRLALVEIKLDSTRRWTGESVARVCRMRKA